LAHAALKGTSHHHLIVEAMPEHGRRQPFADVDVGDTRVSSVDGIQVGELYVDVQGGGARSSYPQHSTHQAVALLRWANQAVLTMTDATAI